MKTGSALLGLVLSLGIGYFIYKAQLTHGPLAEAPPQQIIDVTGVEGDLLSIAQAERLYLASNNSYATLDQLQQDGSLTFPATNHRGYRYVAEIQDNAHFQIIATPSDPAKRGWPSLSIDETMQIVRR